VLEVMALRILIADDSSSLRRALKSLLGLSPEEWQICGEAVDGNEAVTKALELTPDVVLLDLAIPKLTGVEVVKALREQQSTATVVLMSQQDPEVMRRIAGTAAVPYYVVKSQLATDLPDLLRKLPPARSQ
jgi:DNA-binding NarL/FixJ family response regulator